MPRKILIVEDDGMTAMLIGEALKAEMRDNHVQNVKRLDEALSIIHSAEPPDAVVLDLTLLDADRETTLARVNEIRNICPVAIITGHPAEDIERKTDVPVYEKGNMGSGILTKVVEFAIQVLRPSKLDESISKAQRLIESPPPNDGQ